MKSLAESLGLDADLKPLPEPCVMGDPFEGLTGKAFALAVLDSPDFRRYIVGGLLAGDLPPGIIIRLMDHGWGKPPDRVELTGRDGDAIITRVERVVVGPQFVEDLERAYQKPNVETKH